MASSAGCRAWMVLVAVAALVACDGGGGGEDSSSGGEAPISDTCAGYAPTDACIDADNFAQCRQKEAECPGEVRVLESCPLHFACP